MPIPIIPSHIRTSSFQYKMVILGLSLFCIVAGAIHIAYGLMFPAEADRYILPGVLIVGTGIAIGIGGTWLMRRFVD